MEPTLEMRRQVRTALSVADELSRLEHREHAERASETLAALRTTLQGIDLHMEHVDGPAILLQHLNELTSIGWKLRRLPEVLANDRPLLGALVDEVGELERRMRDHLAPTTRPSRLPPAKRARRSRLARVRHGILSAAAKVTAAFIEHRNARAGGTKRD
jgi:hypothetical protein